MLFVGVVLFGWVCCWYCGKVSWVCLCAICVWLFVGGLVLWWRGDCFWCLGVCCWGLGLVFVGLVVVVLCGLGLFVGLGVGLVVGRVVFLC